MYLFYNFASFCSAIKAESLESESIVKLTIIYLFIIILKVHENRK